MKRLLFVFAVVSGFLLMTAKPALATMEGHEVSVVNPYANCVGVGADGTGLNYPNTEPEPWVAHNPANPDNYVGGFQQDRWNDGAPRGWSQAGPSMTGTPGATPRFRSASARIPTTAARRSRMTGHLMPGMTSGPMEGPTR